MTEPTNDGALPRLPSVEPASLVRGSNEERSQGQTPSDHGVVHVAEAAVRRMKWVEYVEPELLELRLAGRAVVGIRIALAAWAIAVVVAAALLRSAIADDTVSTKTVSRLGLIGVLLALIAGVIGWYWADRATQDVHRLQARLPSRLRCASAWALPFVWFGLSSVTILRLDPTEPVDVRGAVVALVFVAVMWRPYSLLRRILRSLIRVDSDLAIASGYVLDVALFGLVWARLVDLPSDLGPTDGGVAGALLGLGAVAAVAAVGNVGVWYVLVRQVDRAVDHRRVAMRTRHDHRQLRLVGIDPLNPRVRLAMLAIAQEEHQAALELAGAAEPDDQAGSPPEPESSLVDRVRDHIGEPEPSVTEGSDVLVDSRTPDGPPESVSVGPPVEVEVPSDVEVPVEDESPVEVEVPVEDEPPVDVEVPVEDESPEEVDVPVEAVVSEVAEVPAEVEVPVEAVASEADEVPVEVGQTGPRDPLGRIAARMRADHEPIDVAEEHTGAVGEGRQPVADALRDRLAARSGTADEGRQPVADAVRERLAARSAAGASAAPQDRLDQLLGRLGSESAPSDGRSILDRLERFGIAPGGAAIPDDGTGRGDDDPVDAPDLIIDRLYSLELARYVLVLATIACAGASAWFVTRAVDVGGLVDGEIAPAALDRLEIARLTAVRTLAVTLALVPLWCGVAAWWANRVDLDVPGAARCAALTVVSGAFVGAGFVADPASNVMLFTMFGCLGAALWSVPVMIEIERRAGRGTTIPSLLPLALGFAVLIVWVGGLLRPVSATDSPEAMSFSGGLLALVMAIAAVVTTVAGGDLVEAIKLSPAAPRRQRGSSADAG